MHIRNFKELEDGEIPDDSSEYFAEQECMLNGQNSEVVFVPENAVGLKRLRLAMALVRFMLRSYKNVLIYN